MKRAVRWLLLIAPLVVLLAGIPTGVALARRASVGELPPDTAGPPAPVVLPYGPPVPTHAPRLGPNAPTHAPTATPKLTTPPVISTTPSGIAGTITRIDAVGLVVYTMAKKLVVVVVDPKTTVIRFGGREAKLSALRRGDQVVVLGHSDNNEVFHAGILRATRPDPPLPPNGKAN